VCLSHDQADCNLDDQSVCHPDRSAAEIFSHQKIYGAERRDPERISHAKLLQGILPRLTVATSCSKEGTDSSGAGLVRFVQALPCRDDHEKPDNSLGERLGAARSRKSPGIPSLRARDFTRERNFRGAAVGMTQTWQTAWERRGAPSDPLKTDYRATKRRERLRNQSYTPLPERPPSPG
jgi:hypothetical protein